MVNTCIQKNQLKYKMVKIANLHKKQGFFHTFSIEPNCNNDSLVNRLIIINARRIGFPLLPDGLYLWPVRFYLSHCLTMA